MYKSPCDGGCWYCYDDSGEMVFCCEFDTFLHLSCLEAQIQEAKGNPDRELKFIMDEFGY